MESNRICTGIRQVRGGFIVLLPEKVPGRAEEVVEVVCSSWPQVVDVLTERVNLPVSEPDEEDLEAARAALEEEGLNVNWDEVKKHLKGQEDDES